MQLHKFKRDRRGEGRGDKAAAGEGEAVRRGEDIKGKNVCWVNWVNWVNWLDYLSSKYDPHINQLPAH